MQDYLDYKLSFHVWSIESFLSIIMEISILLNFFSIEFLFVLISHAKPTDFFLAMLLSLNLSSGKCDHLLPHFES